MEIEGGCYFFNPDIFTQSYDSANEFCQGMGSYLAVVKSGDENRGIIDVLLTPNGKWGNKGLFTWCNCDCDIFIASRGFTRDAGKN